VISPMSPRIALASLLLVLGAASCSSRWEPAFDEVAASGLFEKVDIAPPEEALTFARARGSSGPRVLLVTAYENGSIRGVDLTTALEREVTDPIRIFEELGYDRLLEVLQSATSASQATVPASQLVMPVDLGDHHVAAATNFPEHAGDAGVEDGPFLFAKLVAPTGPHDPVPAGDGLLDYEVEVAWVTLAPLRPGDEPPYFGLVLCNDFTDRETLLHHVDPWDVESGAGFTTGKSFPGFLPIGDLFVVPRDPRRFALDLDLELYVNGALRQRSKASEMVWDLDEIVARTWAWKERRWDHRGAQVSLLPEPDAIPARTLLLSGTPHGTVFAGLAPRHYLFGLTSWLAGGWNESVPQRVIAEYVDDARSSGAYLQPGDRVEIHVDRMGVVRNRIEPAPSAEPASS
jgi:2,4-didehydro-3-deoxy-L-rhamnonate hydrolase